MPARRGRRASRRRVCPSSDATVRRVRRGRRPGQVDPASTTSRDRDRTELASRPAPGMSTSADVGAARVDRHRTGLDDRRRRTRRLAPGPRVEGHRLAAGRGGGAGQAAQVRRQGRAEEGDVGQAPAELLGDDGDLDRRGPRRRRPRRRPQLPPAGGVHGGVELAGTLGVVELGHGVRTPSRVHHLRRGVAQRDLLGREPDVHYSRRQSLGAKRRRPLVAQGAAEHLARRRPGDGVDEHHVAQALVGGERVADESLQLSAP